MEGEEVTDAREVFVDLGVLIVEGRVPGGQFASGRGYGEGPHCIRQTPSRHDCDNSFLCTRAANLRKHMQLLWENNVPMCVEVLLCTDCPCGIQKTQCPEIANVPSASDLLLEQWTVTMVSKKAPEVPQMTARGLLQAVRSQLHFSQLSAWWSSSKGADPVHVSYRVTVLGEAFASHFRNQPVVHSFPVASVGRNAAMKVSVRSNPRMESVPKVFCNLHHNTEIAAVGGAPEEAVGRSDKLLGESLLDPPQSLDHFSRRFQSPTRGCSPSLQVPRTCRREGSPPSPPMSLQPHRLGREGLARRRDATSWQPNNSVLPPTNVVDDRMQHPCNRSGKHHCRCDEELESLPELQSRESVPLSSKSSPQPQSFTTKEFYSEQFPKVTSDLKLPDKQCSKRVKKDTVGSMLNLELSPQEFREVLSVLRDRNPGTKSLSRSPDMQTFKVQCCSTEKEPPKKDLPAALGKAALGKADLFLEAILRTSDSKCSTNQVPSCDDVSFVLSNKISKICLDNLSKKSSCLEPCGNSSGTKRKRLEAHEEAQDKKPNAVNKVTIRNIDERTLSNVPRMLKINFNKSDLNVKVPCDANIGKTSSNSVIVDTSDKTDMEETKETEVLRNQMKQDDSLRSVPSTSEKEKFRRNLDFAASMVFHSRTGLPLTSSPAPVRRNATCFDYDSTITSVSAIRSALFEGSLSATASDDNLSLSSDDAESEGRSPCSPRVPFPPVQCQWSHYTHLASSLLGTFEESVLNGRLEPVSTVQGFTANLGASGSFCPRHVSLPVTVFFYTLGDNDKVSTPYLAHINLGKKGYNVPRCGTIQVTLFNPLGTVVKMFVVMYDLTDMPANSQTFLRQRTLYMPANTDSSRQPDDFQKWLRYLVHLRFSSSKSGRLHLHSDIRMIIFRKSDLDTATAHGGIETSYELRSFTQGPNNPKFSSRK